MDSNTTDTRAKDPISQKPNRHMRRAYEAIMRKKFKKELKAKGKVTYTR